MSGLENVFHSWVWVSAWIQALLICMWGCSLELTKSRPEHENEEYGEAGQTTHPARRQKHILNSTLCQAIFETQKEPTGLSVQSKRAFGLCTYLESLAVYLRNLEDRPPHRNSPLRMAQVA